MEEESDQRDIHDEAGRHNQNNSYRNSIWHQSFKHPCPPNNYISAEISIYICKFQTVLTRYWVLKSNSLSPLKPRKLWSYTNVNRKKSDQKINYVLELYGNAEKLLDWIEMSRSHILAKTWKVIFHWQIKATKRYMWISMYIFIIITNILN